MPSGTVMYSTVDGITTRLPAPQPGNETGVGTGLTPVAGNTGLDTDVILTVFIPPSAIAIGGVYHMQIFLSSYSSDGFLTYTTPVEVAVDVA